MNELFKELDEKLIQAIPSERQLNHAKLEYYAFIHFTVNTFTNKEWGNGTESEDIFNPTSLDTNQWAKIVKDGCMKGLILTCKHHDGFCLWPSKYTKHSVKNSPYKKGKGDVVKETAIACKKAGIKFGVYLSPWDRNCKLYGQGKLYDDYYINQLTELLTNYGDIFTVWLDGACGEGCNGKKQVYDWDRYFSKIRELQPNANIAIVGPDIRWCGNEAGNTRESEWSVVSSDMANPRKIAELSQTEDSEEFRKRPINAQMQDLGSRKILASEKSYSFYPSETDLSIRPSWFYHEDEDSEVKSFETLKDIYLKTVGGNSSMLLNLPPTQEGKIHNNDAKIVRQLGNFIKKAFKYNLAKKAKITVFPTSEQNKKIAKNITTQGIETFYKVEAEEKDVKIVLQWNKVQKINYIVLQEAIQFSQRVEKFSVICKKDAECVKSFYCTVIGWKKIISTESILANCIEIIIEDARVSPIIAFVGVY